ncbi:MAG: hypothetical protein H6581_10265 [Bacteroidia bacterium]|nr:hypothetical protein [Bacteroidia bacterium]
MKTTQKIISLALLALIILSGCSTQEDLLKNDVIMGATVSPLQIAEHATQAILDATEPITPACDKTHFRITDTEKVIQLAKISEKCTAPAGRITQLTDIEFLEGDETLLTGEIVIDHVRQRLVLITEGASFILEMSHDELLAIVVEGCDLQIQDPIGFEVPGIFQTTSLVGEWVSDDARGVTLISFNINAEMLYGEEITRPTEGIATRRPIQMTSGTEATLMIGTEAEGDSQQFLVKVQSRESITFLSESAQTEIVFTLKDPSTLMLEIRELEMGVVQVQEFHANP